MRVYVLFSDPNDYDRLRRAAKAERRSVSSFVSAVVIQHLWAPHHGALQSKPETTHANRKISRRA